MNIRLCIWCNGRGIIDEDTPYERECSHCHGTGFVENEDYHNYEDDD